MKKLAVLTSAIALGSSYLYHQNKYIQVTHHTINHHKIPNQFNGYKILQFSDFHNKFVGYYPKHLVHKIKHIAPDIIVITGDLVDSYHPNFDYAKKIVQQLIEIAPVYYVTGNHEWRLTANMPEFMTQLTDMGVILMDNQQVQLIKDTASITLQGVPDLNYIVNDETSHDKGYEAIYLQYLKNIIVPTNNYTILLAHRPEMFEVYQQLPVHLIFTGHAHGGQWRLWKTEGLYAPSQGFMPKYTAGIHQSNDTMMIVSRGLGSSSFPIRLWNYPELIVVTLQYQENNESE